MALRQRRRAEKLGRLVVDDVGFRDGEVVFDLASLQTGGQGLLLACRAGREVPKRVRRYSAGWKKALKLGRGKAAASVTYTENYM